MEIQPNENNVTTNVNLSKSVTIIAITKYMSLLKKTHSPGCFLKQQPNTTLCVKYL